MSFLRSLFLVGLVSGDGPYWQVLFINTLWMLLIVLAPVYLALLFGLALRAYGRTERVRELADIDTRVKLCAVWSIFSGMVLTFGTAGWLYFHQQGEPDPSRWHRLVPPSAHLTVLTLLFLVWLAVHMSLRKDSRTAKSYVP